MNKYLIIAAFALTGCFFTACGEVCYECVDLSDGQVIQDFCAVDEDTALEEAVAIEQQQENAGNPDVECSRN